MESLSTFERIYILKSERDFEGYEKDLKEALADFQKELSEAQEKIKGLEPESPAAEKLSEKIEQLELQVKQQQKAIEKYPEKKAFVEKYGPTEWIVKSISRRRKYALMSSHKIGGKKVDPGSTGAYMVAVVDEHLLGWKNYRRGGQEIPFSKEMIDYIDEEAFSELFREITGAIEDNTVQD